MENIYLSLLNRIPVKKGLAALLLSILFTSQVGYHFIYTIHQQIIKEAIEKELLASIPESSLEVIILEQNQDKIEWEEENKEFFLDGEMYDVAKIRKMEGKTYLYCINDKREKELIKQLAKAVNSNHNTKQEKNNLKSPLPDLVCMNDEAALSLFSVPSTYSFFTVTLVSSFEEITMPPPKA